MLSALRTWRVQRELTLAEAGKLFGVPPQTFHRWETGESIPRATQIQKMPEMTGGAVTAADFYAAPEPARSGSDGAASPAPGGTGDPVASDARPAAPRRGSAGRPLSVTSAAGRKAAETRKRRRAAGAEVGA